MKVYNFNNNIIRRKGEKHILFSRHHPFTPGWWAGELVEKERCFIFIPKEPTLKDVIDEPLILNAINLPNNVRRQYDEYKREEYYAKRVKSVVSKICDLALERNKHKYAWIFSQIDEMRRQLDAIPADQPIYIPEEKVKEILIGNGFINPVIINYEAFEARVFDISLKTIINVEFTHSVPSDTAYIGERHSEYDDFDAHITTRVKSKRSFIVHHDIFFNWTSKIPAQKEILKQAAIDVFKNNDLTNIFNEMRNTIEPEIVARVQCEIEKIIMRGYLILSDL